MSEKVTPIRTGSAYPSGDQFDRIYDGIQAQLDALCCVRAVLFAADIEADEDLTAARALLHRTFHELNRLHYELGEWRVAQPEVRA